MAACFGAYRVRGDDVDPCIGRNGHRLVRADAGLRFKRRTSILDLETLHPFGKPTITL